MAELNAEQAAVVTEWAVDGDFGVARVADEAAALRWVQSYVDHPEALDPGESVPVAVSRTVTTSPWRPTTPPALSDPPEPRGGHCPGCGWSSGGHDPRCPAHPQRRCAMSEQNAELVAFRNPRTKGKAHLFGYVTYGVTVAVCGVSMRYLTQTSPAGQTAPEDRCKRCFAIKEADRG